MAAPNQLCFARTIRAQRRPTIPPGKGSLQRCQHTFQAYSRLTLPGRLEFDQWLRWTASVPANSVPPHTTADVRLGRQMGESGEISLNGQNLLPPRFVEFGDS